MTTGTAVPPRNVLGDRASPSRYRLKTHTVELLVHELGEKVASADAAADVFRGILATLDTDQDHFIALALDLQLQLTGFKVVSSGSQSSTLVDPKVVFRWALLAGAVNLIVAHDHPSGDPTPSPDDIAMANKLREGGRLPDIQVLDSLVIGATSHVSMKAEDLIT